MRKLLFLIGFLLSFNVFGQESFHFKQFKQIDKQKHVAAGALSYAAGYSLGYAYADWKGFNNKDEFAFWSGVAFSILITSSKEIYDIKYGTTSIPDLAFGLGGAAVMVPIWRKRF